MPTPNESIVPLVAGSDVDRLLSSPDPAERVMALKQPGVTEHHLWRAIQDPNQNVFWEVLHHPLLNSAQIDYALQNRANSVDASLLSHPAFTDEHLDQIFRRPEEFGLLSQHQIAESPRLTAAHVNKLLDGEYPTPNEGGFSRSGGATGAALRNPALTPEDIVALRDRIGKDDELPRVLYTTLFQNPSAPVSMLSDEIGSPLYTALSSLRVAIAEHPKASSEAIARALNEHLTWDGLQALAAHPNFSEENHRQALSRFENRPGFDRHHEVVLRHSRHTTADDLMRAYLVPNPEDPTRAPMLDRLTGHPAHSISNLAQIVANPYMPERVMAGAAQRAPLDETILRATRESPYKAATVIALQEYAREHKMISPQSYDFIVSQEATSYDHLAAVALRVADLPPERLDALYDQIAAIPITWDGHSDDREEFVRSIVGHPNVSARTATQAAQEQPHNVKVAAVESGKVAPHVLRDIVMNNPDPTLRKLAVEVGGSDVALAGLRSPHADTRVDTIDRHHGEMTPEMWEQALTDHDWVVRSRAVKLAPALLPDQAHRALTDEHDAVRGLYAGRHDVPPEHLAMLIKDPNAEVRKVAIQRPQFPMEHMQAVASDEKQDPEVRALAQARYQELDPDNAPVLGTFNGQHDVPVPGLRRGRVRVRVGTHKLRGVRDAILGLGLEEAHPKQLPPGDWKAGRTAQGLISAKKIQQYIDGLPFTEFNVSHGRWTGAQRHSDENSKVMRFEVTSDQARKLHAAGVFGSFINTNKKFAQFHQMPPHTVGWVRYTGTPKNGIHIDEIQSDLNHALVESVKHELRGARPDEIEEAVAKAEALQPVAHHALIKQLLFGNKPPTEWLHEAFLQYMRDRGNHNTVVHMPTASFTQHKLVEAGHAAEDRPPAAHIQFTYDSLPKKAGYEDAHYGEIPTQKDPRWLADTSDPLGWDGVKPPQKTRKTVVRKSEYEPPEEEVYISDTDHFADAQRLAFNRKK